MPQGPVQPLNSILYAGDPDTMQEKEIKTATSLAPGRLVEYDSNDYSIKVAGASSVVCIGVLDVMPDKKLTAMQKETIAGTPVATAGIAYATGDQVRVLKGDIIVKCLLLSGQTITVGERLEADGAGTGMVITEAVDGSGKAIGYAAEDVTSGNYCKWILVKLTI